MNITRTKVMVCIRTVLWSMAVLSAMTSSGFLIYKTVMKMPLDDDALVLALSGTLITWVFVYSGTRVMYGIETIPRRLKEEAL